jgi:hypothetical protein
LRYLPFLIELVLTIYALISCIQTPDADVPYLHKIVWVLLIVLVPVVGPIVWLLVSRAARVSAGGSQGTSATYGPRLSGPQPTRVAAPDDDPEFLAWLERQQRRRTKDGTTKGTDRPGASGGNSPGAPADGSAPGEAGPADGAAGNEPGPDSDQT